MKNSDLKILNQINLLVFLLLFLFHFVLHFIQSEAENHALNYLSEVIHKLINDPGQFDVIQKELTTLYLEFTENHHVISNAIEIIFVAVSVL